MVKLEKFHGPLTAIALTEWLNDCDMNFEEWEDDNGKELTDKQKVSAAGHSFSNTATSPSRDLALWWEKNHAAIHKTATWDKFVDMVMERALRPRWEIRALEAFYRTEQGTKTVDQYFGALDAARLVVDRAKLLETITDSQFKYHLLFHANASISTRAVANKNFDVVKASIDDVKAEIRELSEDTKTLPSRP